MSERGSDPGLASSRPSALSRRHNHRHQSMSIQDLGAIGELVSSIVVVITLVYLAVQTSLARKAAQANLQWTRANAARELSLMWAANPETVQLIEEFGTRAGDLKPSEEFNPRQFRYLTMNRSVLELLQAFYLSSQSAEDRNLAIHRIRVQMKIPGFKSSWPILRNTGTFYAAFVDTVEHALATDVNDT
jgi:hypothetical protein